MKLTPEQIKENEKKYWTRSAPADLYYHRDSTNPLVMHSTDRYVTNTLRVSRVLKYPKKCLEDLITFFMSTR